ncbi:tRNA (uridine(54)-C5)-methyltransferase TrmA [Glaciecola sp. SC05]|uniref:tRNA (uridine(54)-C5)-methyltransferase TrmA n=1 Tax=Glaciecola sp. SC05 TaxID=1987355 RepID=UPI003528EE0C
MSDMKILEADYKAQLLEKHNRLSSLLSPFFQESISTFESTPEGYRMRAEFRIWHDGDDSYHIMFDKNTKLQYKVERLPAACALINDAMQSTIEFVKRHGALRKKLFQIDYLASTNKQLIVSLIYHKPLDESWSDEAESLRLQLSQLGEVNIIGRSKKQKLVLGNEYVIERLSINSQSYKFKQVENSFTQPNAEINVKMIEWTINNLEHGTGDLLELYCGAGNFSVPLSTIFHKVLATEISKTSVAAAQYNISENNIDNLTIARLSSEEFTQAYNKTREFYRLRDVNLSEYEFTTVLVDPPRAGLDNDTINLISRFETIVYISCNPDTLAENLKALAVSHQLTHVALFDQFPFTEHIETGVILRRIAN